jgi:2,4-didehydro-3-deoxy-L-rhamnonate hydrolase
MSGSTPYALGRFRTRRGLVFTGVVIGEETVPLIELDPDTVDLTTLLADWPARSKALDVDVAEVLTTGQWQQLARPVADLDVLAPVQPMQVFQSGANYKTHVVQLMVAAAAEAGDPDPAATRARAWEVMDERAANGSPYVFIGLPSSVCGPRDEVVLPDIGVQHDWELELAAVIGTEAHQVDRADAMAHVAGYVVVNDLTTRDRVFRPDMPSLGTDWLAGKNSPRFLPTGPWFVPAQFVPDPTVLTVRLSLNDEVMQDESTSDMIFDIPALIAHVSAITPMRPGDLLLTGSPAGNGAHYGRYLRDGDVMTGTITGPGVDLGTQRTVCVTR